MNSITSFILGCVALFTGSRVYVYGEKLIYGPWADTFSNLGTTLGWSLATLLMVVSALDVGRPRY